MSARERQRHRRRRRRTAYKRKLLRRRLLLAAGVVGGVIGLTGLFVGVEAIAARSALETTRSALLDAREAIGEGDISRARDRTRSARVAVDRAAARTSGPHWRAVAAVPGLGETPSLARGIVSVVEGAVEVGESALRLAEEVLGDGASLPVVIDDGRIALSPLLEVVEELDALPVDALEATAGELAALPDRYTVDLVRDAREEALEATDELVEVVELVQLGAGVIPPLLGADGPRRYLVMVQNPGELRGTGGLIGFLAVLEVAGGAIELTEGEGVNPEALTGETDLAVRGRFGERIEQPVDRPEDFARRYDHLSAGAFLAQSNTHPDMPTVAPVVLDIYAEVTGEELDGIIALDPVGLQYLYETIGPLPLSEQTGALAPELPNPIPASRLAEVLLIDVYEVLGGSSEERRVYQTAAAEEALTTFLASPWDGPEVARAMGEALAGRHLQVITTDEQEAAALRELGVAGEVARQAPGDDLLAVSAVNAAGTKADVHVAHHLDVDIQLGVPRWEAERTVIDRTTTLRVAVENAVDLDSDPYITRTMRPDRLDGPRVDEAWAGLVRTWFSVWLPGETAVRSVRTTDGFIAPFGLDRMHELRIVDHVLETPHGATTGFETVADTTLETSWDGREATYDLTLWRQAKATPDHVDLTVSAPSGWEVIGVAVEGGGRPTGLGPGGADGTPARAEVQDGAAVIVGSITADLRVSVRLAPA